MKEPKCLVEDYKNLYNIYKKLSFKKLNYLFYDNLTNNSKILIIKGEKRKYKFGGKIYRKKKFILKTYYNNKNIMFEKNFIVNRPGWNILCYIIEFLKKEEQFRTEYEDEKLFLKRFILLFE